MNAIALIKQGLETSSLTKIAEGYKMLTGESITVKENGLDKLAKIKAILDDIEVDIPNPVVKKKVKKSKPVINEEDGPVTPEEIDKQRRPPPNYPVCPSCKLKSLCLK